MTSENKANYDRAPERNDPRIVTANTILTSSSKYLNHAGLRNWVATEYLRRPDPEYDSYSPVLELYEHCLALSDIDAMNAAFREARRVDPDLDRWFDRAYLADYRNLDGLASLPPGTLGREFYDEFIVRRDLKPDFLPDFRPEHEVDYWLRRAQQIHDIHHIITESPLNNGGEVRIIGIYMGNWTAHLPPYLASQVCAYNSLLVHAFMTRIALHKTEAWAPYIAALHEGATMGMAMRPLYLPEYERMWDVPISRIQSEMRIRQPDERVDTEWLAELAPA